ncbi:MAG: ATP-binding protein [Clostridia bacterium]|nr:ATP-binding protein [Clostridia bacterium]
MERTLEYVKLSGRLDAGNAARTEQTLREGLAAGASHTIDADGLEYVSSAGLRVILRLMREFEGLRLVNVRPEVYEILDMTGFTQMLPVERRLREISVEGCELLGCGSNASVYRIDGETAVKVFGPGTAPEDILNEREKARLALILGLPTAISFEVVKVGGGYGSVFELLSAEPLSGIIANEPERFEECALIFASLLKKIHSTRETGGKLPGIKRGMLERAEALRPVLEAADADRLVSLISAVPDADTLVHGDYHPGNIMVQDGEALLIDMDTLSVGRPIFELGFIYNAFLGYYETDREAVKAFQGFDYETSKRFFERTLELYLGTNCPHKLKEVADKARLLGLTRLLARSRRLGLEAEEAGRAAAEHWRAALTELIRETDCADFDENELYITAERAALPEVLAFIEERAGADADPRELNRLFLAAEEVFVNIADYACPGKTVKVTALPAEGALKVVFEDDGPEFDPLKKQDPDVTLPAAERRPGGLGIFMAKRLTDGISYERRDGKNLLTLVKKLCGGERA